MVSKSARKRVKREQIRQSAATDHPSPRDHVASERGQASPGSGFGPHTQSPAGPPRKKQKIDTGMSKAPAPNPADKGSSNEKSAQPGSGTPSQHQPTQTKPSKKKKQNENTLSKKEHGMDGGTTKSSHPPVVHVVKKTSSNQQSQKSSFTEAMQKKSSQEQTSPSKSTKKKSKSSNRAESQPKTVPVQERPDIQWVQTGGSSFLQTNQVHSRPDGNQSNSLKTKSDSLQGQSTNAKNPATRVASGSNLHVKGDGQISRGHENIPINLRPITRLWALEHLKGLTGSNPQEPYGWFNVRALSRGQMGLASPEDVVKMFQSHKIFLTDLVTLDLGWPKGEWMVRIIGQVGLRKLSEKACFADGVLVHTEKSESGFDYLISRLPTPEELEADAAQFPVPVVLMGIPYYFNPALELDRYLYESITAQNKPLGIEAIAVQQRYQIGPTRTNDVRCHVMLNSKALHRWEFNRSMRLTVQGWDSAGVPRPELWSVSMRHIDECGVCGSYYHQSDNSAELKPCEVTERLEKLSRVVASAGNSVNGSAADPGPASLDLDGNFSAARIEAIPRDKTSIGFLVA